MDRILGEEYGFLHFSHGLLAFIFANFESNLPLIARDCPPTEDTCRKLENIEPQCISALYSLFQLAGSTATLVRYLLNVIIFPKIRLHKPTCFSEVYPLSRDFSPTQNSIHLIFKKLYL